MASSNFVLHQVGGKTSRVAVPLTPLEPNKVRVKITHSGFCDTDHSFMPLGIALGHEGVGLVEKIGNLVMEVKIGDRVGGGYYRNSCGKCKYCTNGHEMWCYSRTMYGESDTDNGTFSNYFIANETFLYKIPKSMSSEDATPIQFARATTYSALADKVNGGDCVGIVGIGGLGHLAIQFASNLGATVVAISYSRNKEADARAFGAHEFFLLDELENMRFPLDILLLTGSEFPLFEKLCTKEILARDAIIIPTTGCFKNLELPWPISLVNNYRVMPSLVSGRKVYNDMLQFAARHGIRLVIEEFSLTEESFTKAIERMESGKLRYQAVLKNN